MNTIEEQVRHYLRLVEAAFKNASQSNIDRIEAYEQAYPWIVDEAYQRSLDNRN